MPTTASPSSSTARTTRWAEQKEICSICGLLGAHRQHKLLLKKELGESVLRVLKELRSSCAALPFKSDYDSNASMTQLLQAKLKTQMERCRRSAEAKYKVR